MKKFEKINPAIKTTPLLILFTMVLPQLLLLVFRVQTFSLIKEMITEHSASIYTHYFIIPLGLALIAGGLAWMARRREVPRGLLFLFFALQTAGLVAFLISMENLIPRKVDPWIVPFGPFMMLQLASAMPGLFFTMLCTANIRPFGKTWVNITAAFGTLVLMPAGLFVLVMLPDRCFYWWNFSETLIISVAVLATLVAAFAFIQVLIWLSKPMKYAWVSVLLFATLFPLGGLWLNHGIPFPADLQHGGFYALALANGAILLWATFSDRPLVAWLTAFSYPFTCYFFFLFLPFLPFSLPAMLAVGAGFLILTPAILFILHTRQLVLQFRMLKPRFRISTLVAGFLIAFLLVPCAYVARAYWHRNIFQQTLNQIYAAPLKDAGILSHPKTARYALQKMIDAKEGRYIPILSEVYNRIVFGGMTLPDSKLNQLSLLLRGETYTFNDANFDEFAFYSFFTSQSERTSGRENFRRINRDVSLAQADTSVIRNNGIAEATILLTLENNRFAQGEYVGTIHVPSGVFLSGYELKIDGEMVPGRLSDRRAALWVYHKIRDRRLDPGLLIYTGPNTLKLSVFPFEDHAQRICALKFLYPATLSPIIQIDDKTIRLPQTEPASSLTKTPNGNQALCIPAELAKTLPSVVRESKKTLLNGTPDTPGYCPEWTVKKALFNYWNSDEDPLKTVPWFVTKTDQPLVEFDRAAYWLARTPDATWSTKPPPARPVVLYRCGKQIRALSAQTGGVVTFNSTDPIERFDGQHFVPATLDTEILATSRYARTTDLWERWWQTQLHPDQEEPLRKELLHAARQLNILIPSAAFLAVETTAQQNALKKAEKKSLKTHSALAFDEFEEKTEAPEPQLLVLLLIALPFLVHASGRSGRKRLVG